jgi:hypothetical protein
LRKQEVFFFPIILVVKGVVIFDQLKDLIQQIRISKCQRERKKREKENEIER